jgi:hypothetical protein
MYWHHGCDVLNFLHSHLVHSASRILLAVIKCIYLLSTYLYSIQDIEDRCLLLMSSTSFVDLPLQEHRMMKKLHMEQKLLISSLCPKPEVFTDNMTQRDDVAQGLGPADPKWGWPAPHPWPTRQVLAYFQKPFSACVKVSQ